MLEEAISIWGDKEKNKYFYKQLESEAKKYLVFWVNLYYFRRLYNERPFKYLVYYANND